MKSNEEKGTFGQNEKKKYVYMFCKLENLRQLSDRCSLHTHTHTHTRTYMYAHAQSSVVFSNWAKGEEEEKKPRFSLLDTNDIYYLISKSIYDIIMAFTVR